MKYKNPRPTQVASTKCWVMLTQPFYQIAYSGDNRSAARSTASVPIAKTIGLVVYFVGQG